MLKVIQFIHGFNMGGAETLVKDYALGLDREKFDLTILCYERYNSPYERILEDAGVNVIYICDEIPLFGRKGILARVLNKILLYIKIRKYIHKIKPDIIHEHLILNSYLRFAKPNKKTAIFYTQHFQVKRWIKDYGKDIKALKWLMKHYKVYLIALNNSMKQELNDYFNINNTIILKNGINLEKFNLALHGTRARENLGIQKDVFVIGHVGRFSKVKNHEFLIEVFDEVIKRKKNALLLMIGKGDSIEGIKKKINNYKLDKNVIILSDRTDVPELMKAMDVLVFPSFSEGMPVSLVEAQMAGLKCLVSKEAVSNEIEISNLVKYISLQEPASKWADEILGWKEERVEYFGIDSWDMRKVIKHLESLYCNIAGTNNGK